MNDKSLSKNFFYIIENYYYISIPYHKDGQPNFSPL